MVLSCGLDNLQFLANLLKDVQRFGQFIAGMQSSDDGTDAAFIRRNRGIDNALGKDAFLEETLTKLHSQGTFANDHRCDGGLAVPRIEAKLLQVVLEETRVLPQAFDQAVVFLKNIDGPDTGGYHRGWMGGAEEDRASTLQEEVSHVLAACHISTQRTDGLGERANLQGYTSIQPEMADTAAPILA